MAETREIYISLLEEGSPVARPTQGIVLGNDLYRVLEAVDFRPEDEVWEFPPNSIVRCEVTKTEGLTEEYLLAVERMA